MSSVGREQAWTEARIPDQSGRTAVVTGANGGLGFEVARALAERGATVVLACRNPVKSADAMRRIRCTAPNAELHTVELDLMSQASVRTAAALVRAEHKRIDLLVNNAGTAFPDRTDTTDGFEATFATNHLGPFAFTGLLLDRIAPVPGARIVSVSSLAHKTATLALDDLDFTRRKYRHLAVYGQSKLANIMFTYELQRRLAEAGAEAIAVAAHPGAAKTAFGDHIRLPAFMAKGPYDWMMQRWVQSAAEGALASLRAATDPEVSGGEFYGPTGLLGMKGKPGITSSSSRSYDVETQRRLWGESARLTGIDFTLENFTQDREPHLN
ncbi:oxidoreductase [Nocardia sp. A7]|uniref:oxidoreductase n=1 Tax=Nocardia sp. A7 TaxID=2789274 RepID=UPI00397C70DB